MQKVVTKKIYLKSSAQAISLMGQQDENIRKIERDFGVQIFVRQSAQSGEFSLVVRGPDKKVERALGELDEMRNQNETLPNSVLSNKKNTTVSCNTKEEIFITFQGRKILPRSNNQKKYVDAIASYDMVFGIGPAGSGKTYLAVACALRALAVGSVSRIVLTKPVVEAGERLGFLPGDLYDKINPYLKPLYDAFLSMIGSERFRFYREEETVEIVPLAYMRGRTLDNAFLILDEAQNTTLEQMKMFLTRMGTGSKIIVTGDITQIDLENKNNCGLVEAQKLFSKIDDIKFIHFQQDDIVRHPLVKKIIMAYGSDNKNIGSENVQ